MNSLACMDYLKWVGIGQKNIKTVQNVEHDKINTMADKILAHVNAFRV